MPHAIYLMKFSLYLQAKMSGMSKCRHDVMTICRYAAIPKIIKIKKNKKYGNQPLWILLA